MNKKIVIVMFLIAIVAIPVSIFSIGCGKGKPATLLMATTTSTQDSGLLDVLLPAFEKKYNVKVKTLAVGSGEAMQIGQQW